MKRLLVFALVATLGNTSLALAEESLLKAGTRHVQQLARAESTTASTSASSVVKPVVTLGAPVALAMQDGPKTLQSSGLSKRSKALIAIGVAAAFVGIVMAIDDRVEDFTPSTLGTRRDGL